MPAKSSLFGFGPEWGVQCGQRALEWERVPGCGLGAGVLMETLSLFPELGCAYEACALLVPAL